MIHGFRALAALVMAASLFLGNATTAEAATLQCAPYARQISGVQLFGNAGTWWKQAEGVYARGQQPREGAVLAMAPSRAMRVGHVAVVSKIVSNREVLLTHANWSYRGGIERNVRAVDVSANNDWTDVRIWYGPIGDLGLRSNPAFGFIYPEAAAPAATGTGSIVTLAAAQTNG